jgi:hypothetical protein
MARWQAVGDLLKWGPAATLHAGVMYWTDKNRDRTIRAEVMDATRVVLQPFSEVCVDLLPSGDYTMGTEPMWITDRLMALGIMEIPPPPRLIEGVGLRMSATVFWIIAPTKET